jgi:small-conductance mechanosensitive channel
MLDPRSAFHAFRVMPAAATCPMMTATHDEGGIRMTRTRKGAPTASLVLATAMLIAWAIPAGAASSTSAKQWANAVCSAVQTFATSVDATISSLKGSDSLDSAAEEAKSGLQSAVTELEASLKDLGKPPTSDGTKAQTAVQDLSDELSNDVAAIQALLTPPPSTPSEIASAFADIGSQIQKAVSQTKSTANTLKGLKPNGALQKAFQSAPACTSLKKSS